MGMAPGVGPAGLDRTWVRQPWYLGSGQVRIQSQDNVYLVTQVSAEEVITRRNGLRKQVVKVKGGPWELGSEEANGGEAGLAEHTWVLFLRALRVEILRAVPGEGPTEYSAAFQGSPFRVVVSPGGLAGTGSGGSLFSAAGPDISLAGFVASLGLELKHNSGVDVISREERLGGPNLMRRDMLGEEKSWAEQGPTL